jgi:hypothetical protein
MQILTVGGSRSDLSDLMTKLQQALVPAYFENITFTPCAGTSPTQADPSVITFKYGDVYIDLYIGETVTNDYLEFRGEISGTGKKRSNNASTGYQYNPITDIIVTDSGVALIGKSGWSSIHTLLVIGKSRDEETCVCIPAMFGSTEPWTISSFLAFASSTSQSYLYSVDLSAGEMVNNYTSITIPPQRITTTGTVVMESIPTLNGKPFMGVYFPKYNPFSNHPEPFSFTMDGVGYAAIMGCNFIFIDGGE